MSKKDWILIVTILLVMLILFVFGYQDYKRQKALLEKPVGVVLQPVQEFVPEVNS